MSGFGGFIASMPLWTKILFGTVFVIIVVANICYCVRRCRAVEGGFGGGINPAVGMLGAQGGMGASPMMPMTYATMPPSSPETGGPGQPPQPPQNSPMSTIEAASSQTVGSTYPTTATSSEAEGKGYPVQKY